MAPIEKKSSLLFDIKEYYSESENSPNWTVLLFLQMSNIVDKVVLLWKLSFSSSIMPSKKKIPFFCSLEVYSFCQPSSALYLDSAYREPEKICKWLIVYTE